MQGDLTRPGLCLRTCLLWAQRPSLMQVLKVFINQSRPAGSRLADPGMPSSHANSLGYFGSYVVLSALASRPLVWTAVLRAAAALTVTVVLVRLLAAGCALPSLYCIYPVCNGEERGVPLSAGIAADHSGVPQFDPSSCWAGAWVPPRRNLANGVVQLHWTHSNNGCSI